MTISVTLDNSGRVVIPKTLRNELRLAPGDTLSMEFDGDSLTLRPIRSASALRKKRGIWVFHGYRKISEAETDRALKRLRHVRERETLGVKASVPRTLKAAAKIESLYNSSLFAESIP